jgi:hypothetical protein
MACLQDKTKPHRIWRNTIHLQANYQHQFGSGYNYSLSRWRADAHTNGYIYAVSQSHLYKIEPASMTIEASVELPATSPATVYNGLLTSSTGELILKSLSFMGGESEILLVDPDTLETTFTTSCACASPRLSLALDENGVEHMYHLNREKTFRYIVEPGSLTLDPNWIASFDPDGTGINQEPTSPVIVNGRVYYTTNTNIDAELPMRVFWQDVNATFIPLR